MPSKESKRRSSRPALPERSRGEQLQPLWDLAGTLSTEEGNLALPLEPGAAYPVWTPHGAVEAAAELLKAVKPT
jgi:hypothetical protein